LYYITGSIQTRCKDYIKEPLEVINYCPDDKKSTIIYLSTLNNNFFYYEKHIINFINNNNQSPIDISNLFLLDNFNVKSNIQNTIKFLKLLTPGKYQIKLYNAENDSNKENNDAHLKKKLIIINDRVNNLTNLIKTDGFDEKNKKVLKSFSKHITNYD